MPGMVLVMQDTLTWGSIGTLTVYAWDGPGTVRVTTVSDTDFYKDPDCLCLGWSRDSQRYYGVAGYGSRLPMPGMDCQSYHVLTLPCQVLSLDSC